MEGVYGRCWTETAKESAYSPHVTAMPPVGTLFDTGCFKPFPHLAEPPYVNLLKGFLFPTDGPGPVSGLTLRPVSGPTFNCFFNWSWVGDRVWKGVFHNITGGKKRPVLFAPRESSENKPVPPGRKASFFGTFLEGIPVTRAMTAFFLPEGLSGVQGEPPPGPRRAAGGIKGRDKRAVHPTTWNRFLNPIIKNSYESFSLRTFLRKMKPLALPKTSKTMQAVFNPGILNVHHRDSNKNTGIHTAGPDILKPFQTFQTAHHGKTDHARHIIQHMKKIIDNTNSEPRTADRVDSIHNDIRAVSGKQEQMMTTISNQLTDMNRKIDFLQTQGKQTGPLIRANSNSKDGGFYDY